MSRGVNVVNVETAGAADTRRRIVAAAVGILAAEGRDGVSTRAVSAAAGVQAPTIYRLFGDKQGLLDAVATHGYQAYLETKVLTPSGDPVDDLRRGFEVHVGFGLANPAVYALMYGDVHLGRTSPAATAAAAALARHIHRIAEAGRLRLGEEQAAQLVHATGSGLTLSLIATPAERRDLTLVARARDAVIAAVATDEPVTTGSDVAAVAVALRAALPATGALSDAEQGLMREWLDRIAAAAPVTTPTRDTRRIKRRS